MFKEIDPSDPTPFDRASVLLDELEAAVKARRDAELRCARVLAQFENEEIWRQLGCASVGELGERNGLAADEARALFDLGRALRVTPLLEQKVTEGKITVAAASCVAAMLADPKMLRDEDDWIGWAEHETTKRIRQRVRRRREEARVGDEPVCPLSLFVRAKARDDFQRAREVASAKAGRALTPGETFETVVDHYLDTFDVDRVAPGQRRCPPTALVDGRYVPMAVRREIYERQGHECAVPFCGHSMFLEKAHLWAHASGGDREAENLVLLCSTHHWFLDRGSIKVVGTASKPQFFDSNGEDMAKRYEPGGSQSPYLRPTCKPTPAPTPTPTLKELDSRSGPPTRAADPPDSIERAASDPQPSSKPAPAIDPDRFGDPPRSAFTT